MHVDVFTCRTDDCRFKFDTHAVSIRTMYRTIFVNEFQEIENSEPVCCGPQPSIPRQVTSTCCSCRVHGVEAMLIMIVHEAHDIFSLDSCWLVLNPVIG